MRFSIYRRHDHFVFKPKPVFRIIPRQCCLYDCLCVLWVFHLLFHDLFASYLLPHASFDWPTPPSDFKIIFATIIDLNKPVLWIWYSFQTFLSYEVKTNLLILSNNDLFSQLMITNLLLVCWISVEKTPKTKTGRGVIYHLKISFI